MLRPLVSFQDRLYRHAMSLPSVLALTALNAPGVEARLAERYEEAKAKHRPQLPALSEEHARIVDGLEEEGFYATTLEALGVPGAEGMLAAGRAISQVYADLTKAPDFMPRDMVVAEGPQLMTHPQVFAWGANAQLLAIMEHYLGLPAAYDGPNIYYTVADGRQVGTRRWHRDREDRRMIKLAVYLNDVDEDGGPLQMIRRTAHWYGDSGFDYPVFNQQIFEKRLGRPVLDEDTVTFPGPAGTVIFLDTARYYHRGKPATKRDRSAIFYSYFSRTPRHPFFCERSTLSRSQIAQLAANLEPEERAAALWRDSLPAIAKMVMPSRL